jgi:hypothetical protein
LIHFSSDVFSSGSNSYSFLIQSYASGRFTLAINIDKKKAVIASIAGAVVIVLIIIALINGKGSADRNQAEKQKQINSLFNFMTGEGEIKIDPDKIEKFEVTQAKIIQDVILEKKTVCSGEDVLVTVVGHNPNGSDANLAYRISDTRGNPAILRFIKPGKREFYVVAQDGGSHVDFKPVVIDVVDCPDKIQLVLEGKLASLKSEEAEFEVVKKTGIGERCTYEWDFGDGSKTTGAYGYITHNYALRDQKAFQSTFTATVKATDSEGRTATGRCSISLPNTHYISSLLNDAIIPAQYNSFPVLKGSYYEVPVSFKNIYDTDAFFSSAGIEVQPCTSSKNNATVNANPGSLLGTSRLNAGETSSDVLRIDRSMIPAGTCNLIIRFTGELANRKPVSSAVYLNIVPEGTDAADRKKVVSDKDMVEKLEKAARILGRGRPITPDDLKRLEKEGKL